MDDVSNLKKKLQFAESNDGNFKIVRFIKSLQIYGAAKFFLVVYNVNFEKKSADDKIM